MRSNAVRTFIFCLLLLPAAGVCLANNDALWDAKHDIVEAKKELNKIVTFCRECDASGKLDGKTCRFCDGLGLMLKAEEKVVEHRFDLKEKAERLGISKDRYAELDVAKRLDSFKKEIEPEAFKMLTAYVGYMKAYQKHEETLKQDEKFAKKAAKVVTDMDRLIDRHATKLKLDSLKLLREEDPAGKVGVFRFLKRGTKVRIDGKEYERLELRTLKDTAILINRTDAKRHKGLIVAEIIGKDTYKTEAGQEIQGILMQAH